MNRFNRRLAVSMMMAFALALALAGCKGDDTPDENTPPTGAFAELQGKAPKAADLTGWKRTGRMLTLGDDAAKATAVAKDDLSTYETMAANATFAAELPLFAEYKHQAVIIQKYKPLEGDGRILLEVHEMDDPDNAFGYLSIAEPGDPIDHPQWTLGRKSPGCVSFAKDRYVVRVKSYTDEKITTAAPDSALNLVAQAAALRIGGRNRKPQIVGLLPSMDRVPGSEVYLRGPLALKKAQEKFGISMIGTILGPILGNAPTAMATYRSGEGKTNTVFIMNRRLATDTPAIQKLDDYLATAPKDVLNSFVHTFADDRYMIVGSFNAEEESIQRVMAQILGSLGA